VAALIGLVFLLATSPNGPQLRAALTGLVAGGAASGLAAAFRGVAALEGSASEQRRDGAIVLVGLLALMLLAALATWRAAAADERDPARRGPLRHARRLPAVAGAAGLLCVAGLVVGGLVESAERADTVGAKPARFVSVSSLRYEYWGVGARAFIERPLQGEGSGGFRVLWLQERDVDAGVVEVHSLALEMATELGIVGLLLLGVFLGGVALAGHRALGAGAALAPGAVAACGAWLVHALIDWDWQMPAVTLPALVLAAGLLAESER
jgi:O-antigen ligase